jgi:hypothetical protein
MTVRTSEPSVFPLYLRVPHWCDGFAVALNGKRLETAPEQGRYVRIERTWSAGDRVELDMPMRISVTRWPRNGSVTVERGPLSYSVKIGEKWVRCGGTDAWPDWEVLPTTPWNYGLVLDPAQPNGSLEVMSNGAAPAAQPWTVDTAPIEIKAHARRIPGWGLEGETVQELRQSPVRSDAPEEEISMIPLGCARLRMACLPLVGNGTTAREWA